MIPLEVWIVPTATLAPLGPALQQQLAKRALEARVVVTGFGELDGQLLDPASPYRQAAPELTVLMADAHDLLAPIYQRPIAAGARERQELLGHAIERVERCVVAAAATSRRVLVATATYPPWSSLRLLAADRALSLEPVAAAYNAALATLADSHRGVELFDYHGLVLEVGYRRFHDPRMWAHARMHLGAEGITALAERLARRIAVARRAPGKCVVVDLDGTLWGGVLGEDGSGGVQVGGEGVGVAHAALQRELRDLRAQGVLLAVASHNDEREALEIIDGHPGMVLRSRDLSAWRIGWEPKVEQLRQIADELGIGLEALVFVDDSPHEREAVRAMLPEVTVVDLPPDAADYLAALRACEKLDTVAVGSEDRQRGDMMVAERQRAELEQQASSHQAFLQSLQLEATAALVDATTLPRAAQLCQRTNQLNLTLQRHDEAALRGLLDAGAVGVTLRARDRLGDVGMIGFGLVCPLGEGAWEIDTLVMSCRALGRGLEASLLATLGRAVHQRGGRTLVARFVRGPRNEPAAKLLPDHGFVSDPEDPERFRLDLASAPAVPDHVRLSWQG